RGSAKPHCLSSKLGKQGKDGQGPLARQVQPDYRLHSPFGTISQDGQSASILAGNKRPTQLSSIWTRPQSSSSPIPPSRDLPLLSLDRAFLSREACLRVFISHEMAPPLTSGRAVRRSR